MERTWTSLSVRFGTPCAVNAFTPRILGSLSIDYERIFHCAQLQLKFTLFHMMIIVSIAAPKIFNETFPAGPSACGAPVVQTVSD